MYNDIIITILTNSSSSSIFYTFKLNIRIYLFLRLLFIINNLNPTAFLRCDPCLDIKTD